MFPFTFSFKCFFFLEWVSYLFFHWIRICFLQKTLLILRMLFVIKGYTRQLLVLYGFVVDRMKIKGYIYYYEHKHVHGTKFWPKMSSVCVSVEWIFGDIFRYFSFVDFRKKIELSLSPVWKMYVTSFYNLSVCNWFELSTFHH